MTRKCSGLIRSIVKPATMKRVIIGILTSSVSVVYYYIQLRMSCVV